MPVSKPRTRLVYFRITEAEFQQIQHVCELTGARSVSDPARAAIQRFLANEGGPQDELALTKRALGEVLDELRITVQQLTSIAGGTQTPEKGSERGNNVAGQP